MKVFIKNKLISIGGSSEVTNEEGDTIFKVKGKFLSPTKKKLMYDAEGKLLYTIRNKFWYFFYNRTLVLDAEKNRVAAIKKSRWSLNRKYEIEDTPDEMTIEGKFLGITSNILRNGEVTATITRNITLVNDAFTLDAEEKDIPFLTALVIALDNITDDREKRDK